jgi:SAM-dependent methyltransferase
MRVLDVARGDGMYVPMLAERVGPAGQVVAVDISLDYLAVARTEIKEQCGVSDREMASARFVAAALERLPFDKALDLAWCAQSLYSLPDALDAGGWLSTIAHMSPLHALVEDPPVPPAHGGSILRDSMIDRVVVFRQPPGLI